MRKTIVEIAQIQWVKQMTVRIFWVCHINETQESVLQKSPQKIQFSTWQKGKELLLYASAQEWATKSNTNPEKNCKNWKKFLTNSFGCVKLKKLTSSEWSAPCKLNNVRRTKNTLDNYNGLFKIIRVRIEKTANENSWVNLLDKLFRNLIWAPSGV